MAILWWKNIPVAFIANIMDNTAIYNQQNCEQQCFSQEINIYPIQLAANKWYMLLQFLCSCSDEL